MNETKTGSKVATAPLQGRHKSAKAKSSSLASFLSRSKAVSKENDKIFKPAIQDITKDFVAYLRDYTNTSFGTGLSQITDIEASSVKNSIRETDYLVLFDSAPLGGYLLLLVEEELIDLFVSAFYGAAKPTKTLRLYTNLSAGERQTAAIICQKFAEALNNKLSTETVSFLEFNKFLPANELNDNSFSNENLYDFTIDISFGEVSGKLHMLVPSRSYRPLYELMARLLKTKPANMDEVWSNSLAKKVNHTGLTLQAYITQSSVPLYKLTQLQLGQVLPLPSGVFSNINIKSSSKRLYRGSLGKMGSHFSVKIDEFITDGEET